MYNMVMAYMCIPWLYIAGYIYLLAYPFVYGLFTLFTHIVSLDELYHITDGM